MRFILVLLGILFLCMDIFPAQTDIPPKKEKQGQLNNKPQKQTQQKNITYFNLKKTKTPDRYSYLALSIPRSIRSVLRKQGFGNVDNQNKSIENIYARGKIINTGKELNTDLIVCGKYSIIESGINDKIELIILVYDIKGEERVIQKRFLGATGTGMFVMIDQAAARIKKSVNNYYEKREKILNQARKRRQEEDKLTAAERQELIEQQLAGKTVKTRMNNSLYLKSHTCQKGEIKLFTFFAWKHYKTEKSASKDFGVPFGILSGTTTTSYNVLYTQLSVSGSFADNFEIGMDLLVRMSESISVTSEFSSTLGDKTLESSQSGNNFLNHPIFFIKWRALQDENHGFNFTTRFAYQPRFSSSMGAEQLESVGNYETNVAHNFIFGLYFDKTIGRFTPFVNVDFTIIRKVEGEDVRGVERKFLSGEDKHNFYIDIKTGTEWRVSGSFIIQPNFNFVVFLKNNTSEVTTLGPNYFFSLGTNFIIEIAKDTAFSVEIKYYYHIKVQNTDPFDITPNPENMLFIYFYFAVLFDT